MKINMGNATKLKMSPTDEYEARNIQLMNENAELRMRLHTKDNEEYGILKQQKEKIEALQQQVGRFTQQLCEWFCPRCSAEYYGPSAVERGSFTCIKCKGYCIVRKLAEAGNETNADAEIAQAINALYNKKTA